MAQKILVATDGSKAAKRAVQFAAGLAAGLEAELIILHVLLHGRRAEELMNLAAAEHIVDHVAGELALTNVPENISQLLCETSRAGTIAQAVTAIGRLIQRWAEKTARAAGASNIRTLTLPGDYAEEILNVAELEGCDIVVVGQKGLGPTRRFLHDSVSDQVLRRAQCTVIFAR